MKILSLNNISDLIVRDGLICITNATPLSTKGNSSSITQFLSSLPSLIADGVFAQLNEELISDIEQLSLIENRDSDPFEYIFDWAPFQLSIESSGTIGFDDFKYIVRFKNGNRILPIKYELIFAWRSPTTIFRLPTSYAKAILIINNFNSLPASQKDKHKTLDSLFQLKNLSSLSNPIYFDEYLKSENIIKPNKISLGVIDDGQTLVAYPKIDNVDEAELKKHFLNSAEVKSDYDLSVKNGTERQRLILSNEVESVFKSIKNNAFGLSGKARDDFYRSPRSILPEGEGADPEIIQIDPETGFGPRVKGIGFPSFVRPVKSTAKENWFNETDDKSESNSKNENFEPINFVCDYPDGEAKNIVLETMESFKEFKERAKSAQAKGENGFQWENDNIPISDDLLSYLDSITTDKKSDTAKDTRTATSQRLLIHTNEDEKDYSEPINSNEFDFNYQTPRSLNKDFQLKSHQIDGISWLERLTAGKLYKGGLLADDMGLGKTVQILTFLAWCIETGLQDELGSDSGPYSPILVVAPLILVENWKAEIEKYFDSSIFMPFEILHGSTIKKYRRNKNVSDETNIDKATLDIDEIRKNRLLITNYDTVKNYQCSFAKLPISVVVIDEAQEIKEPNTATTYALKALNPTFRVASTGTPIETSLSNLWSIMDFVQPGNSLGTLKEFNKEFTNKNFDDASIGKDLRSALGYNSQRGLVLRRTKKDVLKDLPQKHTVEIPCFMDENLRDKYKSVISSVKNGSNKGTDALQALHKIASLSQHPFLIEGQPFRENPNEYLNSSTKLSELLNLLTKIKKLNEKVLIFTRSRTMQDILKTVIDSKFNLDVSIVNGDTASKHKYVNNTRAGIISKFSSTDKFDVLILSPEVAGVGLTITSANHVIHYGRWWNPAKENQATDRAYRIGQKKEVNVYHLILKDAAGEFETFDEKLHRLLKSREELADNFLVVNGNEGEIQDGLIKNMFESQETTTKAEEKSIKPDIKRYSPFQFECVTSLLFKGRFRDGDIFVTCKTGDRGVDVIGISPKEILLIQAKMLRTDGFCSSDAINEIIDGLDFYRENIFPKEIKHIPIKLAVVTTGSFDKEFKKIAKDKAIEIYDFDAVNSLYKKSDISLFDVEKADHSRSKSIEDVKNKILSVVKTLKI